MTPAGAPAARLHHVVWCVAAESLPALRSYWCDGFGVPLESFEIPEAGLSVLMSWDAGVEIIAPGAQAGAFTSAVTAFLEDRGEGVFSVVFEVEGIDQAVERAVAAGARVLFQDTIEPQVLAARAGWPETRQRIRVRQAGLVELRGSTVCLQECQPV